MASLWLIVSYMWVWKELSIQHDNRVLTDHWKPGKFWNFISLVWKVMDFDQVVMESRGKWLKMNFVKKQKQKQNKKFLEQSSVIGTVILFVFVGPCLVQRYVRICWACWQKIVKNFKFVNPQFCKDITQNHKICKFCKHVQS